MGLLRRFAPRSDKGEVSLRGRSFVSKAVSEIPCRFAPRKDERKGPRKNKGRVANLLCYFTCEAVSGDYLAYSGKQDITTGSYSHHRVYRVASKSDRLTLCFLQGKRNSLQRQKSLCKGQPLKVTTKPWFHRQAVSSSRKGRSLLFCRPKTAETPQENIRSGLCHALEVRDNLFDGPLEKGNVFCAGIEHCLSINIEVVMG